MGIKSILWILVILKGVYGVMGPIPCCYKSNFMSVRLIPFAAKHMSTSLVFM